MKAQQWLIKAWLFSMGFVYLLDLPFSNTKIQLAEIILLLVFFIWLLSGRRSVWPKNEKLLIGSNRSFLFEGASLLLLAIALIATLMHPSSAAFFETAGYAYLFVSSLLVQWILHQKRASVHFFQQSLIQLGLVLAGLNMLLFAGYFSGIGEMGGLVESKQLPLLGFVPRVRGWMPSVNLLADLMALCWWMALAKDANKGTYARSLFILAGLLFTLSKSLLMIIPLGFYLWIKSRKEDNKTLLRFSKILVLLLVGLYLFLTHVLVQQRVQTMNAYPSYLTGIILAQTEDHVFLETSYFRLKKIQLLAAYENPVWGLGPGNFNTFLQEAKEAGQYPDHLPNYDPHSTLGGTLAEMGLLGLLALLCWAFVIFRMIRQWSDKKGETTFKAALACYLLFIGIEAITTDVLNFRHFWVCLGVLAWNYKSDLINN